MQPSTFLLFLCTSSTWLAGLAVAQPLSTTTTLVATETSSPRAQWHGTGGEVSHPRPARAGARLQRRDGKTSSKKPTATGTAMPSNWTPVYVKGPPPVDIPEQTGALDTPPPLSIPTQPPSTKPSNTGTLTSGKSPSSSKPAGAKSSSEKLTSAKPSSAKLTTEKPTSEKPTNAKSTSEKPTSAKLSGAKPTSAKSSSAKPSNAKPSNAKPSSAKPSSAKPNNTKPTSEKPSTKKTHGRRDPETKRASEGESTRRPDQEPDADVANVVPNDVSIIVPATFARRHSRDLGWSKRAPRAKALVTEGHVQYADSDTDIRTGGLISCTAILAVDRDGNKVLAHIYPAEQPHQAPAYGRWDDQYRAFSDVVHQKLNIDGLRIFMSVPGAGPHAAQGVRVAEELERDVRDDFHAPQNKFFKAQRLADRPQKESNTPGGTIKYSEEFVKAWVMTTNNEPKYGGFWWEKFEAGGAGDIHEMSDNLDDTHTRPDSGWQDV